VEVPPAIDKPVPEWVREIIDASPNDLLNRQFWRSPHEKSLVESEIEYRKSTGQWAGPDTGVVPLELGRRMRERRNP
jgi:hypothetical protein